MGRKKGETDGSEQHSTDSNIPLQSYSRYLELEIAFSYKKKTFCTMNRSEKTGEIKFAFYVK
jgi:hypothetical protein